jgi:hypothetical protein
MDFLYIFMNHICPAAGAVIALLMFSAPMKAVLGANRAKDLGVSPLLHGPDAPGASAQTQNGISFLDITVCASAVKHSSLSFRPQQQQTRNTACNQPDCTIAAAQAATTNPVLLR